MNKNINIQIENRNQLPKLLNSLNLTGSGVEVGVQEGIYSEILLNKSNLNKLYSIDCWKNFDKGKYVDIANKSQMKQYYLFFKTILRLRKFGKRSKIIRKMSVEASKKFKKESLDFVYIDAQHSYGGCKEDIEAWWPNLKKGGVFAGHDYLDGSIKEGEFGVKKAVDEFVKEKKIKLYLTNAKFGACKDWPSWYLIKK